MNKAITMACILALVLLVACAAPKAAEKSKAADVVSDASQTASEADALEKDLASGTEDIDSDLAAIADI